MSSTISQTLTARLPNRDADELRRIAAVSGQTVSGLIVQAVAAKLPDLRGIA